jgi:hypothetical protein
MATKTTKEKVVYLAYTRNQTIGLVMLKVYAKSSYQAAYNWLADIADRHGVKVQAGDCEVAAIVRTNEGQTWWLERHTVN